SLVDTKLLGKPDKFSGELGENAKYKDGVTWENWSFGLAANCMAVDPHMAELMRGAAEVAAEAYAHEDLDKEAQRVNTNLYYIPVLTCKDMAQGVVGAFLQEKENDLIKGIVPWETQVQRCEEQTGEKIMESIKKSVLSTRLVPNKLMEHLMLSATRFTTYALVRAEVLHYLRSKQEVMALSGSVPMDLDALAFARHGGDGKGKHGTDQTKGKGPDNTNTSQPRKHCGKKGHKLMECGKATQDKGGKDKNDKPK
ncbi:unnamed protein product, partial [Prorocentrum cordatum]